MRRVNPSKCALCQQVAPLRNSHIVPEFLYGTLYDEKHRFKTYGQAGEPVVGVEQKGTRERLLCDDCEQRFCRYERVAADFYQGTIAAFTAPQAQTQYTGGLTFTRVGKDAKPSTADVPELLHVEGVDYLALKLFLLSLLWRMGVSQLHYFREVELGPHHEARLREMLLNDDPGEPDEYPCLMCLVEADGRLITDYQSQPQKSRDEGRTYYRFYSTGVRFDFCVSNRPIHPLLLIAYCVKQQSQFTWAVDSIHKHPDLVAELMRFGLSMGWDKS